MSIRDVSESIVGTIAVWSIFVDFCLNCVARDFAQAPKIKCHLFLRNRYQEKTHVYLEGVRIKRKKGTCSLVANTRLGNRRESPLILNSMIICNGATQDIKIGFLVIS